MMRKILFLFAIFSLSLVSAQNNNSPYVLVLGIAQDAGYPQIGCEKTCCKKSWTNHKQQRTTSCLAIIDPVNQQQWIIDATPNIKDQLNLLTTTSGINSLSGILLTHAHIGHYTGLMHFGKEVMGARDLPVYCMQRMKDFLINNGPWSQLVELNNITLMELNHNVVLELNDRIQVKPFLVPHRDEFSETVGYQIMINKKSLIFIPDIDKWEKWDEDIIQVINSNDYSFLDATFYQNGEIPRDMSEIPHPFVEESMDLFSKLSYEDKQKVHFIHFNHTNPLLIEGSDAQKEVLRKGFKIAKQAQIITF